MYGVQRLPRAADAQALYEAAIFPKGPLLNQDEMDQLYPLQEEYEEHCK